MVPTPPGSSPLSLVSTVTATELPNVRLGPARREKKNGHARFPGMIVIVDHDSGRLMRLALTADGLLVQSAIDGLQSSFYEFTPTDRATKAPQENPPPTIGHSRRPRRLDGAPVPRHRDPHVDAGDAPDPVRCHWRRGCPFTLAGDRRTA